MKKWEYLEKAVYTSMSQSDLDKFGADGWELVHFDREISYCIFKREIPDAHTYYVGPDSPRSDKSQM